MWRSWLAHLLWEQGVLRSSRSIPTKKHLQEIVSAFFVFPTYHQCSTQGMIFESNEQNPHYQRYNHTLGPRVHVTRAPGVKNNIPKKGYRKVILS